MDPQPLSTAEDFEFEALARAQNYRRGLLKEFAPYLSGSVLEIGAGIGQLTELLVKLTGVERVVAVEPELRFCERLKQVQGLAAVIHGNSAHIQGTDWDAIVCVNVLEHIETDEAELSRYAQLLEKGVGHLCLFVPARQELYAPIDRDFGHFRRYARRALADKLQRAGFSVVKLNYFNAIGYILWWLNFKLLKNRQFDAAKVALFDRWIFPAEHAWERRVLRPPIGQSLLAIARVEKRTP